MYCARLKPVLNPRDRRRVGPCDPPTPTRRFRSRSDPPGWALVVNPFNVNPFNVNPFNKDVEPESALGKSEICTSAWGGGGENRSCRRKRMDRHGKATKERRRVGGRRGLRTAARLVTGHSRPGGTRTATKGSGDTRRYAETGVSGRQVIFTTQDKKLGKLGYAAL